MRPYYIGFDPTTSKYYNDEGKELNSISSFLNITLGEKKVINLKLGIKQSDGSFLDYTEIPVGTAFEGLVDNDYDNPDSILCGNNATDWVVNGSEYTYQPTCEKPKEVYENNVIMQEGVESSLSVGEWAYNKTNHQIVLRLSDDSNPTDKPDGYIVYVSTYTPLFVFTASSEFNKTNSWYDVANDVYRTPDVSIGELSFELNGNTVDYKERLNNSSSVTNTSLQIQMYEAGSA
jgi:hypothetical protein